jgi:hypothetical protein
MEGEDLMLQQLSNGMTVYALFSEESFPRRCDDLRNIAVQAGFFRVFLPVSLDSTPPIRKILQFLASKTQLETW